MHALHWNCLSNTPVFLLGISNFRDSDANPVTIITNVKHIFTDPDIYIYISKRN